MPDRTEPPPSRYRVVERDRRLVVIDTATGADTSVRGAPSQSPAWWPRRLQFDGSAELTTHPLYDDKAPRTLRLDPSSAAIVRASPWVLLILFVAMLVLLSSLHWILIPLFFLFGGSRPRARGREAITRWLDRVEREAG